MGGGSRGRGPRFEEQKEFDQTILELARVTRVTKGGKRMRFRACVIIGDRKGRVGYGIAKGLDVSQSVNKAATQAKKRLVTVPLVNETIPHAVLMKFAAAKILVKPAPKGTGIKAGGALRVVLELAGVPNATGKILGSNNKINNAKAALQALASLRKAPAKAPAATAGTAAVQA
ncbi:30S ribosomal protein S5 [Candidatus Uhrbacteria bacterium RIFCSPHIGHO2_02_FULL_60_10]|uniref:Small ribosomal subunit protein uS5 n=1 Tax=Candidatus Uhrbacteria bacterium RIFCSPHIGHO2_02_FULL_60_10 TaxID=1802392 RepID=A0A1F7U3S3_9BACT|nr:MAG: 30S ribosomal protein S5 [Candidatus Uhrbacteria bacterium RIFCSPHIGHO2_02_FULL_60_10]